MPDPPFQLPGYDVVTLLGFGATGEVWLAREVASGNRVALKRVRPRTAGAASRERMRREAVLLTAVEHPHLVRLRSVVTLPEELVLVLDHAGGGSLAGLLAARGPLTAGEVVTVAVPLAQALAAGHARGMVHGGVHASNVLFTEDGRPLLADLGVARLVGERVEDVHGPADHADAAGLADGASSPAADVYGLGAVCFAALTGATPGRPVAAEDLAALARAAPPALADAVAAALASDPAARPSAQELAALAYDAGPPSPVRLVPAGPAGAGAPVGRRGPLDAGRPGDAADGSQPEELLGPGWVDPAAADDRPGVDPGPRLDPAGFAAPGPPAAGPGSGGDPLTPQLRVAREGAATPERTRRGAHRAPRRLALPAAPGPGALAALPWRGVLTGVGAGAGLALAAALGVAWAGAGEGGGSAGEQVARPAPPAASPAPSSGRPATAAPAVPDWAGMLRDLYATRSQAFVRQDPDLLTAVYASGSPDLAANTRLLADLARTGARVEAVPLEVVSARPVSIAADRVTLRVVDRLAPYAVSGGAAADPGGPARGTAGGGTEQRPGRAAQAVEVLLIRSGTGWRIARTTALDPG